MAISLINVFYLGFIFILFYARQNEKYKMRILLYGSLAFYLYHEALLTPVLLGISLLAYVAGFLIIKFRNHKKIILWIFFILLLGIYFPLKYNETFEALLLNVFHFEGLRWLYLPLGLSFYSFKTMTYVLDIYYERSSPQKSVEKYLLFVSFFPQIFCGPIMSPDEFFSQLKFKQDQDYDEIIDGLRLIAIGTFKKIVLANNIYLLIQGAFDKPGNITAWEWIIISVFTRFYIYYDFAGYSDISNGVSQLFGIKVQKNFDLPFKSKSITEFWRRWHISLSSWIRDYVYYPLVSKFSSYAGIYIGLVLSFVFLGLWHGDQVNYILYGLINGLAVASSTYLAKKNRGAPPAKIYDVIITRFSLYLFLIFLPSLLLMSNKVEVLYNIVEAFSEPRLWFGINYFKSLSILPLVYIIIPLSLLFELMITFLGPVLNNYFLSQSRRQRIAFILFIIFITFSLMSPEVNYRFLYQGF